MSEPGDETIVRPYDALEDVCPGDVVSIWNFTGYEFIGLVVYIYDVKTMTFFALLGPKVYGMLCQDGLKELRSYSLDRNVVRHIAVKKNRKRK